jgi:pyridoxal phosphate enzyme (YggS family)
MQAVKQRIAAAALAAGRDPASVDLLAVSKTWPADRVRIAARAGQKAFGENYVQEGVDKIAALADLDLEWHFIGPLQSNKTRLVASHFHWMHSLERFKVADRLSSQRPQALAPLNVCIQVNVSGEASKSGVAPDEVVALARQVAGLPRLRLRGLMCIPEPGGGVEVLRERFGLLRELLGQLTAQGHAVDTLSMGMSDDLEVAIEAGSTLVRVGSAIFGSRTGVGT